MQDIKDRPNHQTCNDQGTHCLPHPATGCWSMHPSCQIEYLGVQAAPHQLAIEIAECPKLCQREALSVQPDCNGNMCLTVSFFLSYGVCVVLS